MRQIILLCMFLSALSVSAQTNCGYGLPCGQVPYDLPQFPILRSPTPADYTTSNTVYFVTDTPQPTITPYITPTQQLDTVSIADNVATIQAIFEATEEVIYNELGTPVAIDETIAANGDVLFSYVKGFDSASFGVFSPLITFILFSFTVSLSYAIIRISIPVLAVLIGIVRKIIELILEFIPF